MAYLARRGYPPPDAEDLAQAVLLRFVTRDILDRADPAKGRFRNLVFGVTRHVLGEHERARRAARRGGGRAPVSLDRHGDGSEPWSPAHDLAAPVEDQLFDHTWVEMLLTRALDGLAKDQNQARHDYYDLVQLKLQGLSNEEMARKLGCTAGALRTRLYEARKRLFALLDAEVARYAVDDADHQAELAYLRRYLPRFARRPAETV